ncbi:MAG TPA: hypothetical protein VFT51_08710, partial [Bacillales bacterium]|nr:hypothetical protein [Bacillales bacterium]
TGQELPKEFKLRFVDKEDAHYLFVLPDMAKDDELSDDQLEEVAGGTIAGQVSIPTITVGIDLGK